MKIWLGMMIALMILWSLVILLEDQISSNRTSLPQEETSQSYNQKMPMNELDRQMFPNRASRAKQTPNVVASVVTTTPSIPLTTTSISRTTTSVLSQFIPTAQLTTDWNISETSWYGPGLYGNGTACGHRYDDQILGVAHKTLPCGTLVIFSHNNVEISVPVIDRGPFTKNRTWDLSAGACRALNHCFTGPIKWRLS